MVASNSYRDWLDELDIKIAESWEKQLPSIRETFGEGCYYFLKSVIGIVRGLAEDPKRYGFVSSYEADDYFWFILFNIGPDIQKFKSADELIKEYSPDLFRSYLKNPNVRVKSRFTLFDRATRGLYE